MQDKKRIQWFIDGAVVLLLVACIWVPDADKALGRACVWTQFQHWDDAIMLPGWAYTQGQSLNGDIFSLWGMGAVIIISRFAQILGGFDYTHVLQVLMLMAILYYLSLYVFVRIWSENILLAIFAVALAVKIQLFNSGVSPLVWNFPQDTPARHFLDIPVLWCLWQHSRRMQGKYLVWAGIGIGVALAWVLSTGLCLLVAFWGYLIFLLMIKEYRSHLGSGFKDFRRIFFYGLSPLFIMLLVLFLLQGPIVFHLEFWKNVFEPIRLFLQGGTTVSIYACLFDRHFFAFIAGFVIPVIYVWTLIVSKDKFIVPLCIYGLAMYTHYLASATTDHYYATCIPLVLVVSFWLSRLIQKLKQPNTLRISLCLALGAWGALFTNIFFVYYPNIFDIIRMDWKPEISFYQAQSRFDQDASMIAHLTPQTQEAAVISSFETQMLMQAKRKPFFYYAPLVIAHRLDESGFTGTSVFTQERLTKTLNQIDKQAPEYIFIEKRLLGQWPKEYVQRYAGIVLVLQYIVQHYTPQEQGMYLIAMQRKV